MFEMPLMMYLDVITFISKMQDIDVIVTSEF